MANDLENKGATEFQEAVDAAKKTGGNEGTIVRIVGPVVDVMFEGEMPSIYDALIVDAESPFGHIHETLEVESQLPGGIVRTVAMSSTDGLQRGIKAINTGAPMMMPVGPQSLGRVWNVLGKPVDGKAMPEGDRKSVV